MENQTQTPAEPTAQTQNGNAQHAANRFLRPPVHLAETEDGYVVQVEMPGVNKSGLEITFENGELTLVGRRTETKPAAELLYRESRPLDYRRVFEVDSSIDASQISASLEQGVLTLRLPKAEAAKPRRIEVSGLN